MDVIHVTAVLLAPDHLAGACVDELSCNDKVSPIHVNVAGQTVTHTKQPANLTHIEIWDPGTEKTNPWR